LLQGLCGRTRTQRAHRRIRG